MVILLALSAFAGTYTVEVTGVDCAGCMREVDEALQSVPGVIGARASFDRGAGCVLTSGELSTDAVAAALKKAGFGMGAVAAVDACPEGTDPTKIRVPWADTGGKDVVVVSRGDKVDLDAVAVPGKFTLVDFSATWCGSCATAEARVFEFLESHDAAVRAIVLPGANPTASFAAPVAVQHLANAPGLPWFRVISPTGKTVYRGGSIDDALAAIAS
jgi:copper chaperone CopZ/thiol-disulfide isomerase/thioredoxin